MVSPSLLHTVMFKERFGHNQEGFFGQSYHAELVMW